MKRSVAAFPMQIFVCALLLSATAAMSAQQANAPDPYAGVSNPPPDSTITTPEPPPQPQRKAKPAPGKPMTAAPEPKPAASQNESEPMAVPDIVTGPETASTPDAASAPEATPAATATTTPNTADGTDSGIVVVEPENPAQSSETQPALSQRAGNQATISTDPDGDIVHPAPPPPGTVTQGTTIRARLLEGLSTAYTEDGDKFRAQVASDVFRGDQVLIPAGAEIDGTVTHVSSGHFAGHGSMLLRPETVILPNGSHYRMYAELAGTPGSNTRVGDEGNVTPGSRIRKDSMEYGGGVGVGAVAGAALGGPAGALAGTLVGAGVVTVHLLMDHPQATLKPGTVLLFTLTEPLNLVATGAAVSE